MELEGSPRPPRSRKLETAPLMVHSSGWRMQVARSCGSSSRAGSTTSSKLGLRTQSRSPQRSLCPSPTFITTKPHSSLRSRLSSTSRLLSLSLPKSSQEGSFCVAFSLPPPPSPTIFMIHPQYQRASFQILAPRPPSILTPPRSSPLPSKSRMEA